MLALQRTQSCAAVCLHKYLSFLPPSLPPSERDDSTIKYYQIHNCYIGFHLGGFLLNQLPGCTRVTSPCMYIRTRISVCSVIVVLNGIVTPLNTAFISVLVARQEGNRH